MSNGLLSDPKYAGFLAQAGYSTEPAATPAAQMDDEELGYKRLIEEKVNAERELLRQSLLQSVNKNPDQMAQIESLSKQTGIPRPMVEKNLAEVIRQQRAKDLQETARYSPILGRQLTDPEFARVAFDDVQSLSGLEFVLTKGRDYVGSLGKGVVGQGAGAVVSGFGELYGVATRQMEAALDKVLPNSAMSFLRTPVPWYVAPDQILKRPGKELKDFGELIGAPKSRRGLDTDVFEGIGQLGFQIVAYLVTGGTSSTAMLTAQGADVMAEKTRKDDATQAQKDAAIIAGSGITALTETVGLDRILNRVPPSVRNRTLRFLADKAAAFGIEFAQELTEGLLHDITRRITTNENAPILEGALQEGTAAGLAAAIVRAGLGVRGYKQARDQEEFFKALGDNAKSSKLRERLPDKFQELLARVTEAGPVQNVYIPADQFRTYYQSQGIDPEQKAVELNARNYTEAVAAGTDLVIPINDFTARIAPSDDLQGLMQDLRLSQGDMTAREFAAYKADEERRTAEIIERAKEVAGEIVTPELQQIRQEMRENLIATGYEQTTADAYATVYAKTISNLAERAGLSAVALHKKYDLTVTRPLPNVLTRNTQSDISIDPLLDRLRKADFPSKQQIYGKSLTDFLVEKGGLQPRAEIQDIDVGKPPSKRLLRETGLSIDEAAMLAVEAGYLQGKGLGDITESDLFDAIENEAAGGIEYSIYEVNQELQGLESQLEQLQEYLNTLGIDISQIEDNAEVRRLIDAASEDPEIAGAFNELFQGDQQEPRLLAVHGISEESLQFADKMGGLPVPSIGVVTEETGDVEGFGNITLIGKPGIADPAREPVFSADAYTVRFPRPEWPKVDPKVAANFAAELRPLDREFNDSIADQTYDQMANKPNANELVDSWLRSTSARAMFLREKGMNVAPVMMSRRMQTDIPAEKIEEIRPFYEAVDSSGGAAATIESPEFKALEEKYKQIVREYYSAKGLPKSLVDKFAGGFGFGTFDRLGRDIQGVGQQVLDRYETSKAIDAMLEPIKVEYKAWVEDKVVSKFGDPFLRVAGKKVPYTLPNIAKVMAREAKRGAEKTVTYGTGQVRAASTVQFSDVEQMRQSAKTAIVDLEEYKEARSATDETLSNYREMMLEQEFKDGDTWKQLDASMRALARWSTGKNKTPDSMRAVMKREGFLAADTISDDDIDFAIQAANDLLNAPVPYFEAKPDRIVTFDEFAGAVVPDTASQQTLDILQKYGIQVQTYNEETGDRSQAIRDLSNKIESAGTQVFFQGGALSSAQEVVIELGRMTRRESPRTADPKVDRINAAELYVQDMARQNPEAAAALAAEMRANAETWSDESGLPPEVIGKYASVIERQLKIFRQGEGMADKKGFIQFGPERKFKIALLERADLSTFLHESGHFYLEVLGDLAEMPESSQQIKDDYAAVLKFLNLESRQQLSLDGKAPGSAEYKRAVDAHEKFARANEAYLMEGKAPSMALRSLFQRFREWLKLVYKEMSRLNVELTDEVRGVFDRIYATDEEIDSAKAEMSFDPLFLDATAAGMTEAEFNAYKQSVAQATESGKEALTVKLMKEMQREREAWWKDQLVKVREEVAAEVDSQPVYIAFKQLTEGDIKLNKDELVERYGLDYVNRLPRGFQRVYTTAEGVPLDAAARLLGFPSGDSLIEALIGMRPRNEYIKAEADRVMLDRYGDMMTDGTISDEAKIALHNTQRERVLAAELRALRRKQREVAPFIAVERQRQAAERRAARAAVEVPPMQAFRDAARGMIGQTAIRDLEPQRFLNAQRREGRKAFESMGKGDYTAAAEAKQRELLNHFLYLEASQARDRSDKIAAYMRKFETKEIRQRIGKAGANYLEQIDAILDGYEFRRMPNKTIDRRALLNAFVQKQEDEGNPVNIPVSVLEDGRQVNYRLLSVDELDAVNEAVRNIDNLAKLKNRLTLIAEKRELNEVAGEAIEHILANSKGGKAKKLETALPGEQLSRWAKGFMAIHKKFATYFRQMDGWQDGGMMWDLFIKPLNARADWEAVQRADATKRLREIFKVYSDTNMFNKTYIPALGQGMTLQGRLMVALNWGRAENRQRLIGGNGFTQSQIDGIFETLTERDWQFVKDIWSFLDSYWPDIAAQYQKLYGVAPEKSEALPFMTKYGEMPGGYFPIKYDPVKSTQAQAQTVEEVSRMMKSGAFVRSQTKNGFTKEVLENLDRAIKLDFSSIYEHANEVIHDLALREYLLDTNKLLNHRVDGRTIKDTINDVYGDQAYREIANGLRDIAAGDIGAMNAFDAALGHLRAGVSIIGMGWNLMTGLMQPLGITQSFVRVGPKWVAKGLMKYGSDAVQLQNSARIIYEKSAFMRTRNLTQNREINEIRNQIKRQGKFPVARQAWGAVEDSYFFLITQGQKLVDIPTWFGAYEKAIDGGASESDAVALADQAVIDAQGGGQIKDLASIQRGSQLMKIWTNFYSYFNTTFNLTVESVGKTNFKNPIDIGRLAVDMLMLYTVPAILGVALREGVNMLVGGEEPDEEELMDKLIKEQITYVLGTMVGLREFATVFDSRFGYSGPAGVRFIAEVERLGMQIAQGELDDALRKAAVNVTGILLHFPAGQVNRIIDGIYGLEEGDATPAAVIFGPPKQ